MRRRRAARDIRRWIARLPRDVACRRTKRRHDLVVTTACEDVNRVGYYERWAKTWEFQALLKARAVAGDSALGAAYVASVAPMVWAAAGRPSFVEDVQAMRRRVVGPVGEDLAG